MLINTCYTGGHSFEWILAVVGYVFSGMLVSAADLLVVLGFWRKEQKGFRAFLGIMFVVIFVEILLLFVYFLLGLWFDSLTFFLLGGKTLFLVFI